MFQDFAPELAVFSNSTLDLVEREILGRSKQDFCSPSLVSDSPLVV